MFKFLALVALAALASAANLTESTERLYPWSPTGRIIGGSDTNIELVPYQISLESFGRHICGGTIISKYWIVTAGHCAGRTTRFYTVRAGTTRREIGGSRHRVQKIIVHENYGSTMHGTPNNDVALMRVVEPFDIDETRQPMELFASKEDAQIGATAVITGWGVMNSSNLPSILQIVEVPIISKRLCNDNYKIFGGISDGQICAGYPEGGKDACQGDSGGPLVVNGRLAGIVSWGNGCAMPEQPGVYTEVAHYRNWIKLKSKV